jgi:hypothetical protein
MVILLLGLALVQVAPPPPPPPPPTTLQPGQPPQPRDTRPARAGTGVITGIVTAADTGQPLRRAQVMLMGPPLRPVPGVPVRPGAGNPSVLTDFEGRFEFTGLAAGTYRVQVMPGGFRGKYMAASFGAASLSTPPKPIELKDGQHIEANVALPRGAAINGRVIDEFGEPISRVMVSAARVIGGGARFQRMGGGLNQTDDLGRFRVYGLEQGEYIVGAESRNMGMGGPPVEGETEGFATTYYPSALTEKEAGRVRVMAGGESDEIQIQLVRTRTFRITGIVMDSKGNQVKRPNAMLYRRTLGSGFSGSGVSFDDQGKFTIRDIVPGDYRLVIQPVRMGGPPPPGLQVDNSAPREYASVPLSVASNIEDLVVITRQGVAITGEVVFAEGPPATLPRGFHVNASPGDPMMRMGPLPNATVGENMQFTLNDLFGPVYIRFYSSAGDAILSSAGGGATPYTLKEVRLGGQDITDVPVEFSPEHNKRLQVVLTRRVGTLEGTVSADDATATTPDTMILVIPEEKASWRMGSPRMRTGRPLKEGKFSIANVLPGRYYLVAVPRERMPASPDVDAEYFEQLTKEGTAVVLNEGETRVVDLRVAKPPDR